LAKHKILSHAETMELIREAQGGSEEAKEKLMEFNTRLIWSMVQRYNNRGYDAEDLFQIGAIGFLKSINKFDMSYEVKFTTYAVPMIIGEIQRFIRDDGTVKVSRSIKELAYKIKRQELLDKSPEHICEVLEEKSIEQVKLAIQYIKKGKVSSMDEVIFNNGDGDDITVADQLESDVNGNNWLEHIALRQAVDHLSPRERRILDLRYFQDFTQSEVAKELGVSQVQVSRLEKRILLTLKELLKEDVEMARGVKGTGTGDRDKAIHLLKYSSHTLKEISDGTGVPSGTIGALAKEHRPKEITEAIKARTKALKKDEKPVETPVIDIPEFKGELDKKKKEEKSVVTKEKEVGQHLFIDGDEIIAAQAKSLEEVWRVKDVPGISQPEPTVSIHPGVPKIAAEDLAKISKLGVETSRFQASKPNVSNTPKKASVDMGFNFRVEGAEVPKEEVIANLKNTMEMVKLYPAETLAFYVRVSKD
jgi:RNA polymerase sporulation-specific sigma factor